MPVPSADLQALDRFEEHLTSFLTQAVSDPVGHQIAYHFGLLTSGDARRGKRLRPRLVIAAASAYGCNPEKTFPACAAIELLHNYSLIHDDIEDGDTLRHGRETLWATFGLTHGINAGDAVGALAQLALSRAAAAHDAPSAFAMSMELARANLDMCQGQALDLALEGGAPAGIETYLEMIEGKTAALFGCAAALGARCATSDEQEIERCRRIGRLFGLGFQIQDDVHGIWGKSDQTGKVAAGDLSRRKKTFPVLWALENDPAGAGHAVADAYRAGPALGDEAIANLRAQLQSCGSQRAATEAADNYFGYALVQAQGLQPLSDFVLQWR